MIRIRKGFEKVESWCVTLSLSAIFIMMLLIFIDVIMRYVFNAPIPGVMEMTGDYFMVIIVYFGISYTLKEKGHVKADIIEVRLSPKIRSFLDIFKDTLVLIILGLIFVSSINLFLDYLAKDIRSVGSIPYLIAPAYLIIAIGILLTMIRLLLNIIDQFTNQSTKSTNL